jgi:hypothetical protein
MLNLLIKVVKKLDDLQIPYLITGSLAMGFYATQRSTKDIDLIIELEVKDLPKFVSSFSQEFYCYAPAIEESLQNKTLFNLIDNESGFKVDFIPLQVNHPFEKAKFEQRILIDFYGQEIWAISPENLIISKLIWIQDLVSEKQIKDLENLLRVPNLDKVYLKNWIEKLNLKTYHISL